LFDMAVRIVIVGAGLSGLSLAFRLQGRLAPAEIQVLECETRAGGTVRTVENGGFTVELGPNGFLDTKPTTIALARELGLERRLTSGSESASKNRFLFLGDGLQRLPGSPGELLKTPLLSWRGKLSFLWERFRRRGELADESIDAFARRRAGSEVAATFADALVTGIYAGDPGLLSLPACFPRVAALEREFGSVLKGFSATSKKRRREAAARGEPPPKGGKLWSFDGGLRVLVDGLVHSLRTPPVYGVRIRRIEKALDPLKPVWTIRGDGADAWAADVVVLTCPAHQQAPMLDDLDAELAKEIAGIPFNDIAVVGLGFKAADVPGGADGFGFIAPQRLRRDLLGVQWCSSIFPGRAPHDMILMRAMCGGWNRADIVAWDDDRLLSAVRAELRTIQNITAEPVFHIIKRWRPGIPQYHLGHLHRLRRIDQHLSRHPGLYLGGNSYRGVAMNDCTERAQSLAERIASRLFN
jgi:oxygen-dependent protoporphyrinogen oxidase